MDTIFLTVIIASVLVILAVSGLAISWLLTGKSSLKPGACGRAPSQKRDDHCGKDVTCGLCGKGETQKDEKIPKK